MDKPSGSRLFVVCGSNCEEDVLRAAFSQHGVVQHIRMIKDKGVAYVKYATASEAAKAMEQLHGTQLKEKNVNIKVILADPSDYRSSGFDPTYDDATMNDPDNTPPRSRLFMVVHRDLSPEAVQAIQAELEAYEGMEYFKSDLVATKGIVFVKYKTASSALKALEDMQAKNFNVAGHRVRAMLAQPKQSQSCRLHQASRNSIPLDRSAGAHHVSEYDLRSWHSGSQRLTRSSMSGLYSMAPTYPRPDYPTSAHPDATHDFRCSVDTRSSSAPVGANLPPLPDPYSFDSSASISDLRSSFLHALELANVPWQQLRPMDMLALQGTWMASQSQSKAPPSPQQPPFNPRASAYGRNDAIRNLAHVFQQFDSSGAARAQAPLWASVSGVSAEQHVSASMSNLQGISEVIDAASNLDIHGTEPQAYGVGAGLLRHQHAQLRTSLNGSLQGSAAACYSQYGQQFHGSSASTSPSPFGLVIESPDDDNDLASVFITDPLPAGISLSAKKSCLLLAKVPAGVQEEHFVDLLSLVEGLEVCEPQPRSQHGDVHNGLWYLVQYQSPDQAEQAKAFFGSGDVPNHSGLRICLAYAARDPGFSKRFPSSRSSHADSFAYPLSNAYGSRSVSDFEALDRPPLMPIHGNAGNMASLRSSSSSKLHHSPSHYSRSPWPAYASSVAGSLTGRSDHARPPPPPPPGLSFSPLPTLPHRPGPRTPPKTAPVYQAQAHWPAPSPNVVFLHLSMPMPDYAIADCFRQCGEVAAVVLHSADVRYGAVVFRHAYAAQQALVECNNLDLYGCRITCVQSDISPSPAWSARA